MISYRTQPYFLLIRLNICVIAVGINKAYASGDPRFLDLIKNQRKTVLVTNDHWQHEFLIAITSVGSHFWHSTQECSVSLNSSNVGWMNQLKFCDFVTHSIYMASK